MLCQPGSTRTEETLRQHYWWNNLRNDVRKFVTICNVCQKQKKQKKKYGLLPKKKAEAIPWERLCVDLIGPYQLKTNKGKQIKPLRCVTMIDPATSWFEIVEYDDKQAITVANIVEQNWLARYPRPSLVNIDRGREFIGQEFARMIEKDYGIKRKIITTRNPQANAIIEWVHQTLGNMIR